MTHYIELPLRKNSREYLKRFHRVSVARSQEQLQQVLVGKQLGIIMSEVGGLLQLLPA